jgi:hypothetical protein
MLVELCWWNCIDGMVLVKSLLDGCWSTSVGATVLGELSL